GLKPSDEISKPSRRELDDAIATASKLANGLGYRLSYWLVPVSGSSEKGGPADG
nr:hypothetical protein [Chloroflexota bacterium]